MMDAAAASKIKLTCENCVRAKVKCTGLPGPCERCAGWRNLDCVFLEERKRGRPRLPEDEKKTLVNKQTKPTTLPFVSRAGATARPTRRRNEDESLGFSLDGNLPLPRTLPPHRHQHLKTDPSKLACVTSDCWSSVGDINCHGTTEGPAGSPSTGLSYEQARVVEIFFELYKNHASNRSCCREWFGRQVNKICAMLKCERSYKALLTVVEWMNKHQILVAPMKPPESKAFLDPDSGFAIPPMTSSKGPMLEDESIIAAPTAALKKPPTTEDPNNAIITLEYTRDERCTVKTNQKYVELFGRDANYYAGLLDTFYGGILPWGGDVFSNVFYKPIDTMLLIRVLAYRFQSQPRMQDATPVTRTVQTSHLFTCVKADGTFVDCIVRFNHVEHISFQGVAVEVTAAFEPYSSSNAPIQPPAEVQPAASPSSSNDMLLRNSSLAGSAYDGIGGIDEDEDSFMIYSGAADNVVETNGACCGSAGNEVDTRVKEEKASEFNDEWIEDLLRWVDHIPKDAMG